GPLAGPRAPAPPRLTRLFDDVTLDVELTPGLPLLDIDYVQIDQVLTNLLENAVRHSPPGSAVQVSAECAGRGVAVFVSDHGPGIDPSEADELFEPVRTGGASTSTGV